MCGGDTPPLEEASAQRQWTMKEARALFAIKELVDDGMLEYLMEVETPKLVWDIYASMFCIEEAETQGQCLLSMWKT